MEYIKNVCKIGQGADCCRYLTIGADGWECGKMDPHTKEILDKRVDQMNAKGDNCEGVENLNEKE